MRHLLMAHQQESFLPFSSQQSLSCCLSHMAKRNTPKPPGPLSSTQNHMLLSYSLHQSCVILSLIPEKHMVNPLLSFKTTWSSLSIAAAPRFKSQCPSSSAAPFPPPPTISYTCQHSLFFQLYWAAIVSLGRCGPMGWNQSSPSSDTGAVTRGSFLSVTSGVEVTSIPLAQSMATAI